MPILETNGLNALKGRLGASIEDYKAWKEEQTRLGKINRRTKQPYIDRLYKNQQFINKYGLETFESMNAQQRDAKFKHDIVQNAAAAKWSPYQRRDKSGKITGFSQKPIAGNGASPEEYERIMKMGDDSLLELLDSSWTPTQQIQKKWNEQDKALQNTKSGLDSWRKEHPILAAFGTDPEDPSMGEMARNEAVTSGREYEKKHNEDILNKIEEKDLNARRSDVSTYIDGEYNRLSNELSEQQINDAYLEAITPSKTNVGNPVLRAQFDDNGKPRTESGKAITLQDKVKYLANLNVLSQIMDPHQVYTTMYNDALHYVADHESFWEKSKKAGNEFMLTGLNYFASGMNGVRTLSKIGRTAEVWQAPNGEVIGSKDPRLHLDGKGGACYMDEDGNDIPLRRTRLSQTDLDYMGKDANGDDYSFFFNNKDLRDAERFNTLDYKELNRARKLGYSDMSVTYRPGEQSSLVRETAKMMAFPIIDGIISIIPGAGEAALATKWLSGMSKLSKAMAKTASFTSKAFSGFVNPTMSAIGIGQSYAINTYGESVESNLTALQEKERQLAQNKFYGDYESNSAYKKNIDKKIEDLTKKYKSQLQAQIDSEYQQAYAKSLESGMQLSIPKPKIDEEKIRAMARDEVMRAETENNYKAIQNDPAHLNDVNKAYESATDAALTMAITDAAKYWGVNMFGYRNYLFKSPLARQKEFSIGIGRNITEEGGKLVRNKAEDVGQHKLRNLAKIGASQFWGGAWTNFTDEMQSWGSRTMNENVFNSYLNGELNGDAATQFGSNVASFIHGANLALGEETTWRAGLIGGLGSIAGFSPNAGGIMRTIATKEGRQAWKEASKVEKASMIINNGILSGYAGKVAAERNVDRVIDQVNSIIDHYDEFRPIIESIALDNADAIANNDEKATTRFLKALSAIELLKNVHPITEEGVDPSVLDLVANKSTALKKVQELLTKLAEGKFTEQEAADVLAEYYSKNPDVARSEENNQEALQQVISNAQTLQEAREVWEDVSKQIDDYEKKTGRQLAPAIRSRLLQRIALDRHFVEGFANLDKEIKSAFQEQAEANGAEIDVANSLTERTTNAELERSPFDAPIEVFGNKEGVEKQIRGLEEERRVQDKQLENLEKKREKLEKELEDIKQDNETSSRNAQDKLTDELIEVRAQKAVDDINNSIQSLKDTIKQREKLKERLTERLSKFEENGEQRVLSEQEIMALDAISVARMLDPNNTRYYSEAQQEVIRSLTRKLIDRLGEDAITKVISRAVMTGNARANRAAYEAIKENPELAYDNYMSTLHEVVSNSALTINQANVEELNNLVKSLEVSPNSTNESVISNLYSSLLGLSHISSQTIADIENVLNTSRPEDYAELKARRQVLSAVKSTLEFVEDIGSVLNNIELDDVTKGNLVQSLQNIYNSVIQEKLKNNELPNGNDFLAAIEELLDLNNSALGPNVKDLFKRVVDSYNALLSQKKSTVIMSPEQQMLRLHRQERVKAEELNALGQIEDVVEREKKQRRDKALETYNRYLSWARQNITFDREAHKYYINGQEVDYSVTEYLAKMNGTQIGSEYQFAATIGDSVDAINRDFFKWLFFGGVNPETLNYSNISDAAKARIIADLKRTHEEFKKMFGDSYIAITEETPLVGEFTDNDGQRATVAGTMDMLIIDQNGNTHIIDFKAKKSLPFKYESDRVTYTAQQNAYRQMYELNTGTSPQSLALLWYHQAYPTAHQVTDGIRYHYETDENGDVIVYKLKPAKLLQRQGKDSVIVQDKLNGTKKHYIKERIGTMKDLEAQGKWTTPHLDENNISNSIVSLAIQTGEAAPLKGLTKIKGIETNQQNQEEAKQSEEPVKQQTEGRILDEFSASNRSSEGSYKVISKENGTLIIEYSPKKNNKARGDVNRITVSPSDNITIDYNEPRRSSVTGQRAELIVSKLFPEVKKYLRHGDRGAQKQKGAINVPYWIDSATENLSDKSQSWDKYWNDSQQSVIRQALRFAADAGLIGRHYVALSESREINRGAVASAINGLTRLGISSPADLINYVNNNQGKNVKQLFSKARQDRAAARSLELQTQQGKQKASQQAVKAKMLQKVKETMANKESAQKVAKRQSDRAFKNLQKLEEKINTGDENAIKKAINIIDQYRQGQSDYKQFFPAEHNDYVDKLEKAIRDKGYTWKSMRFEVITRDDEVGSTDVVVAPDVYEGVTIAGNMTPRILKDGEVVQAPEGQVYIGEKGAAKQEEIAAEETPITKEEATPEVASMPLPDIPLIDTSKEETPVEETNNYMEFPVSHTNKKGDVIEGQYEVSRFDEFGSTGWDIKFSLYENTGVPTGLAARTEVTIEQLKKAGIDIKALLPEAYKTKSIKGLLLQNVTISDDYADGGYVSIEASILLNGNRNEKKLDIIAGPQALEIFRLALPEVAESILGKSESKPAESIEEKVEAPKKEVKSNTDGLVRPTYFDSTKNFLADKKSSFDYYTTDESNTRETPDGTLITGPAWQSTLSPVLNFANDSNLINLSKEDAEIVNNDTTAPKQADIQRMLQPLIDLGINSPAELVKYVEEHTQEDTTEQEDTGSKDILANLDVQLDEESGFYVEKEPSKQLDEVTEELAKKLTDNLSDNPIGPDGESAEARGQLDFAPLLGNTFYRYHREALRQTGEKISRVGDKEDDIYNAIFNWYKAMGIQHQEIIDLELNRIFQAAPELAKDIRVIFVNPEHTSIDRPFAGKSAFMAIEYTPTVQKLHNEELGKPIEAFDNRDKTQKKFLIIGNVGYYSANSERGNASFDHWNKLFNVISKPERQDVFGTLRYPKTDQRFLAISPGTEFYQMGHGFLMTSKGQYRSISELLNGPNKKDTNPRNLKLEDLKWGVIFETGGMVGVNVGEVNTRSPKDIMSNLGATFLLLESSNGEYIPAFVQPARYNELVNNSTIKNDILSAFNELLNPDVIKRVEALDKLSELVVLQNRRRVEDITSQIYVGTKEEPIIKITYTEDSTVKELKFDLRDRSEANMKAIIDALENKLNPRINLTLNGLGNSTMLRLLDEAGAIRTDLTSLATSNADFSVLPIGTDGKPIQPENPFKAPNSPHYGEPDAIAATKLAYGVNYKGVMYDRTEEGLWVNRQTKEEVSDADLFMHLELTSMINNHRLQPTNVNGTDYYVYTFADNSSMIFFKNPKTSFYNFVSQEKEAEILEQIKKQNEKKAMDDASKKILDKVKEETPEAPTVDTTSEEELKPDTIIKQQMGVFTDSETSKPAERKETPKSIEGDNKVKPEDQFKRQGTSTDSNKGITVWKAFTAKNSPLRSLLDTINADTSENSVKARHNIKGKLTPSGFMKLLKDVGLISSENDTIINNDVDTFVERIKQCL